MNTQSNSDASPDSEDSSQTHVNMSMNVTSNFDASDSEQHGSHNSSLPFRLLLVSDLMPQHPLPEDWEEADYRHQIGDKSVADLMAELTPTLSIEVSNTLSASPDAWSIELSFPAMTAFEPQHIAQQMAPTNRLLNLRTLVQDAAEGALDAEAFQSEIRDLGIDSDWIDDLYRFLLDEELPNAPSSTSSPDSSESGDALGRVMDMVDTDDPSAASPNADDEAAALPDAPDESTEASGSVGALAAALDANQTADGDTTAADQIVRRLNDVLQSQVEAVLAHPDVRRLESAWRGLAFLSDQLDLDANVELSVLPAGRDELHEALHHQVLMPEHDDTNDEPPTSLILVDQAFGRKHVDIDQMADLAATGESLQAPVVTSVGPEFFGMETFQGLRKVPTLRSHLQGSEYIEWDRLREEEASAFLGLTVPSLLLRGPYTADEASPLTVEAEALFGNGALAVGAAAARSFRETGWPTHLSDHPIASLPNASSQRTDSLLAARLSGSMQSELARAGFVVLDEIEDRNAVRIAHASSVREPGSYNDPSAAAEARMELALPCRLFAGRAAHHLFEIKRELDLDRPLGSICEDVAEAMASILNVPSSDAVAHTESDEPDSDASDGSPNGEESGQDDLPPVLVEEAPNVDLPNEDVLAVRLRPPNDLLSANARLAMALRVPKGS